MHIAVCDDNIADRKQMQRLLERASDQNKKDGLEGFFIYLLSCRLRKCTMASL